jgi:serine/threonine protein kinase
MDFGLSVEDASSVSENIVYVEPYHLHDPSYKLDMRSDIYSLGVLLWELTSEYPPFSNLGSGAFNLAQIIIGIVNGKREDPIENTPLGYQNLYQKCWHDNPDIRPEINEVYEILFQLNFDLNYLMNY